MIINFKDWLREQSKKSIEVTKKKYEAQQWGFGKLFEYNFIKTATNLADTNSYLKIDNVSKEFDYFFGGDFKLTYKDNNDDMVNNMSIYVDITTNKEKKNLITLAKNAYTLSNGCTVSIGFKLKNNFFKYNKPVMILLLDADNAISPIFKEEDIIAIFFMALQHVKYLSYNKVFSFGGETKQGGGKRASELVDTYPGRKIWEI